MSYKEKYWFVLYYSILFFLKEKKSQ